MSSSPPARRAPRRGAAARLKEHWKLARDIVLCTLATWMLIHETLSTNPQPLILGSALVLLGLPPILHADEILGRKQ